ncbi:hypothetical protein Tco_0303823 [Tanacetum coccineum]
MRKALFSSSQVHKRAIAWKLSDIKVSPSLCTLKKGGTTPSSQNEENEQIPTRLVPGCEYVLITERLNEATRKRSLPLPFMDQMLERTSRKRIIQFLMASRFNFNRQLTPKSRKDNITCPYGTFAYRRMPSGYQCPGTSQECMMAIFHDMIEKYDGTKVEVIAKPLIISLNNNNGEGGEGGGRGGEGKWSDGGGWRRGRGGGVREKRVVGKEGSGGGGDEEGRGGGRGGGDKEEMMRGV